MILMSHESLIQYDDLGPEFKWSKQLTDVINSAAEKRKSQKKNIEKTSETKIKRMIPVFLISNPSRYLCFEVAECLLSEITPHGTLGTHRRSLAVPKVHYRMKASLDTLARTLICR
jgi:hypothetical protein